MGVDSSPSSRALSQIQVGSHVEILGEIGAFLVVRLDRERHAADLMLLGPKARMEHGIHVSSLRVLVKVPSVSDLRKWQAPAADIVKGKD